MGLFDFLKTRSNTSYYEVKYNINYVGIKTVYAKNDKGKKFKVGDKALLVAAANFVDPPAGSKFAAVVVEVLDNNPGSSDMFELYPL